MQQIAVIPPPPVHPNDVMICVGTKGSTMPLMKDTGEVIPPRELIWNICGINRFCGAVDFTVGQHTILVYHLVPERLRKHALVHDLHEGICGDVPSPFKAFLNEVTNGAWQIAEGMVAVRVRRWFHLHPQFDPLVYEADIQARGIEVGHLFKNNKARKMYLKGGVAIQYCPELSWLFEPMSRREVYYRLVTLFQEEGLL